MGRPRPNKLIALAVFASALVLLYLFFPASISARLIAFVTTRPRSTCTPRAYANGSWTPKAIVPDLPVMTKPDDALIFAGFQGCASSREYYWHLGADHEEQWDRFPAVTSWEWTPGDDCVVRPLSPAAMIKDMVEQGGWLLIGDSVTENQFFSLSCILYPHVRATPNYTENPYFDRAWPQHLYLSPTSPLLPHLSLPPHFNISGTPLVTFRRVDLLFSQPELVSLYAELHPDKAAEPGWSLFSDEKAWSLPPAEYLALFGADDAGARYRTLVASTGGHWTTTLFSGLADADAPGGGIQNVLDFYTVAMRRWADAVQTALDGMNSAGGGGGAPHQVVVRAYLPGHEDCHDWREPWTEWHPYKWNWYNWPWIGDFNAIFDDLLSRPRYPDIHYLAIDRPALLRPDGHAAGDCLHLIAGTGVLEGWSHYIWHYVTRELPGRVR
ncbi:hypothetical protein BKA93DRAFT_734873 [Sparassis latifolia]